MGDDRSIDDHDHNSECNNQYTKDQTQYEPRKTLNFNAPLLTTRRPANLKSINLSSCPTLHRRNNTKNDDLSTIPFSWEQAPGKPKDTPKPVLNDDDQTLTPRPKLPPSLWRYRHFIATQNDENNVACHDDFDDENVCKDEDEIFSDAMEVFSLSEAIDIVERSQKSHDQSEGLRLKIIEDRSRSENHHEYPDFIIQRFLPDATALALSTAITLKNNSNNNNNNCNDNINNGCFEFDDMSGYKESGSKTKTMSFSTLKGCGFKMLFGWNVKHKLCSVKNPVRTSGDDHVFNGCNNVQLFRRSHNENRA